VFLEADKDPGYAPLCVDAKGYITTFDKRVTAGYGLILLNNTPEFLSSTGNWVYEYPNRYANNFTVREVLLHELGHILGIAHPSSNSNNANIMNSNVRDIPTDAYTLALGPQDEEAIYNLWNKTLWGDSPTPPVGVDDHIVVTLKLNSYSLNYPYISPDACNISFEDVSYPYTCYINDWENLKLKLFHKWGSETIDLGTSSLYINSNLIPNNYFWNRDENGNVIGELIVSGTDTENSFHTSYAPIAISGIPVSTTATLSGNVFLKENLVIESGKTLNILPGSNIIFDENISLISNGLLNAVGTQVAPIVFTAHSAAIPNSWGSIELNGAGASGSIIDNCNINYGNGVRVINVPSFTVSNNNLLDNYISLYIYGSTGGISGNTLSSNSTGHSIQLSYSNVDCNNNKITKTGAGINHGHGIEHNQGSSGKVWRNDVSYCDWGIAAIWGSSPTSRKPNTSILRNNRIRNCNSGLMVYRLSYPNFGIPSTPIYWGNSIYNNTYNAVVAFNYPTYASSLTASNCWWGAAPPNTAKFSVGSKGSFYYDFNLTSDPWAGFQKVLPENNIETETENLSVSNSVQSNANTDEDILYQCVELREQNKFTEAMNLCLSYLGKHPDDQAGYVELYNCYSEETAERIIRYFNTLPKEASSDLKLLLSYLYLKQGDVEKAKQVNEAIVAVDENSDLSVKANLNNFYIALYTENDPDEAIDILLGMVDNTKLAKASGSSVGEMSDAEYSLIQYSKIYDKQIPDLERLKQGIKTLEEGKPDKFELAQNFPNPFNPSTMISYQLPINGYVTLKIYDLLGQEIATLVNEQKSAGKYEVKFDASDLASGVYIYRIQAGEFNASKKLILLK